MAGIYTGDKQISGDLEQAKIVSKKKPHRDLDLSLKIHPIRKDIIPLKDDAAIKNAIRNLLVTNFYERPFHPEIGCGVRELLFENFTPVTGIFIQRKVEEVITNYEPRARISSVTVNEQPDRNGIDVTVYFYVMNMPNPVSVTTVLQRIR